MRPASIRPSSPLVPLLLAAAVGCASPASVDPEATGAGASSEALQIEASRKAIAFEFADRTNLIHGVGGDERLVFSTEPLNGRVAVLDRATGDELATLPPPPGGFLLPFTLRVPRTGRVTVLDAGGFPSPTAPSIPRVYDYDYGFDARHHRFAATLVRSVVFTGLPVVFSEDLEVLDDGTTVVSDSVIGALWLVNADGSIEPGVFPASFAPQDGVPGFAPCIVPQGTVDGLPFGTGGGFGPGVGSVTARDGQLYFGSSCLGGVRRIPLASLRDTTRPPFARGADVVVVSPKPVGKPLESIKGLTFNRWDPTDDRLVATDPVELQLLRIDVHTGAREVLAKDTALFNFPVAAAWLPPVVGLQPIIVSSDQEHRLSALNSGIPGDLLQPPFILTKVYVHH